VKKAWWKCPETPVLYASIGCANAIKWNTRLRFFLGLSCTLASLAAAGCMGTRVQAPDPPAVPLKNAQTFLVIPTYDGSGQATEPDVVSFGLPWHGFKYWMTFSPYPLGDASKENPSIAASNDGASWEIVPGLVNPVAQPSTGAHLDDSSLFYDAVSDELWMYYIEESAAAHTTQVLRLVSSDGSHWQNQSVVLDVSSYTVLSPTIGKVSGIYYMWTVNGGTVGCAASSSILEYRTSSDGVNWADSRPVNFAQSGYVVWHLNVSYIAPKEEFWAAIAAYANGSDCGHTVLFFSKSRDGVNWTTYNNVILGPGTSWDDREIYRSSILFDSNTNRLRVWYSAANTEDIWHVGLAEADLDEFLMWLGS
jgi:hypothetical protein